jgi:transcriptional regulator with XRE-family HTH domain
VARYGGSSLNRFGKSLRECRAAMKLSQVDVARICGVPATAVCHWESGARAPTLASAERVARGLGVSLDAMCGLTHAKPTEYETVEVTACAVPGRGIICATVAPALIGRTVALVPKDRAE